VKNIIFPTIAASYFNKIKNENDFAFKIDIL